MERIYDAPLASGCKQREIVFLTDGGISGGEEQAVCNLLAGEALSGLSTCYANGGGRKLISRGFCCWSSGKHVPCHDLMDQRSQHVS